MQENHHILVHSSFKLIKDSFPEINGERLINDFKCAVDSTDGSLIIPAFTYCFKKTDNSHESFNREYSKSKVGYISELFRTSDNVVRTSSPTHSFSLWGKVKEDIEADNNPISPLGKNSVMEWMHKTDNSYILMLGTDFSAFTFGHYLEIITEVPWFDYSPWKYMGVHNYGVSADSTVPLIEIPGCAKSFVNFEKYLIDTNIIRLHFFNNLRIIYEPINKLLKHGIKYFSNNFKDLLCEEGTCKACDSRRTHYSIH